MVRHCPIRQFTGAASWKHLQESSTPPHVASFMGAALRTRALSPSATEPASGLGPFGSRSPAPGALRLPAPGALRGTPKGLPACRCPTPTPTRRHGARPVMSGVLRTGRHSGRTRSPTVTHIFARTTRRRPQSPPLPASSDRSGDVGPTGPSYTREAAPLPRSPRQFGFDQGLCCPVVPRERSEGFTWPPRCRVRMPLTADHCTAWSIRLDSPPPPHG